MGSRGHPYGLIAASQTDVAVSTVPCGLVSVCLAANGSDLASVTVEDGASGTVVCKMTSKTGAVYCPSKPDACSIGCYVTTGTNTEVTLSIE